MYLYKYIYVYMYMYTYTYTYVHVYVYVFVYTAYTIFHFSAMRQSRYITKQDSQKTVCFGYIHDEIALMAQ